MLGGHSTQLRTIHPIYISTAIRTLHTTFHYDFNCLLTLAKLEPPKMLETPSSENSGLSAELLTVPLAERHSPAIEPLSRVPPEALYTVFGHAGVTLLVALAPMAACLGPLTANIYYPVTLDLSYEFSISTKLTNLTITVYLVFQILAPIFVGSISDAIVPETCRAVVGNGSLPPQEWNISLLTFLTSRRFLQRNPATILPSQPRAALRFVNLGTFQIIFAAEAFCIPLYTGFLFGDFYTLFTALPSDFAHHFSFSPFWVGLCYFPFSLGCMTAAVVTRKMVDGNLRRIAKQLNHTITPGRQNDLSSFPLDKTRIQVIILVVCLESVSIVAYS
ncbi:hypothetical protein BDZ45DRAFT_214340 [Acephala macrosclerotiorum]|nr:hypothetical protein BDZ45DRAFT_214340 [Acephala macrosclerotiorum]